ncbi:beta strand repeat-containing protein [Ensifer soli]|uniref:beta strand repeat-containing protein n=1 Tax=Ciceribacter sp. sgz301302 TaxID=3342379 RepID=UPI0035B6F45C
MATFSGGAGTFRGEGKVFEWSDVIVVIENGAIVNYFTQFADDVFTNAGTDVEIGGFNVQLTQLAFKHFGYAVGVKDLLVSATSQFLQGAQNFTISGKLTNNGLTTIGAMTTLTGAVENNHLMTVGEVFLKLRPVGGDFTLSGSGDMRLRGGYLTGEGGQSSVTDFFVSGRISGHGSIGSDFNLVAFPRDAGYLHIVNTAAGTIEADVSGRTLSIYTELTSNNPLENAGMMAASNGGTLSINGYNGPFGPLSFHVEQTGAGTIKAFNGASVVLNNVVVEGGTLDGQGTGTIQVEGFYTRLANLDISATGRVNLGRSVVLDGTIENRGKIVQDQFDSTSRIDKDGVTLTGGGSLQLMDNYGESSIVAEEAGATLTNADHRIFGAGVISGVHLINQGLISARPDSYTPDPDLLRIDQVASLRNTGILEATGTNTTLGLYSIGGVLDNAGGTIRANGAGTVVALANTSIAGGTLSTSNGGVIRAASFNVQLADFQTSATTRIDASQMVLKGAVVNRGLIYEDDGAGIRIHADDVLLTGGGTVVLLDNYNTASITGQAPGAVLTNFNNTIRGDGFIGGANLTLANFGLIHADADPYDDADSLVIADLASFTNVGRLEARNGATLELRNTADGGIQNTGGTIRATGTGSVVDLADAVIRGGTLLAEAGGRITLARATLDGTLAQVTSNADMDLVNGRHLILKGTIVNSGDVGFTYRSSLTIGADVTLSGGGSFTLNEGFEESAIRAAAPGYVLTNVDQTFAGGAGSFGAWSGLTFVNGVAGVVTANQAGKVLRVQTGTVIDNSGVLMADRGTLDIEDNVTGTGRLEIRNGGTLVVDQGTDQRVVFAGSAGGDTLALVRREAAAGGYDFTVSGMGVGDRIRLDVGAPAGVEAEFGFATTGDGGLLTAGFFGDGTNPYAIRLTGPVSQGQFRLIGAADGLFGFERMASRNGTEAGETMTARAAGERLIGFGGNDTLVSGAGDDVLDGSLGTDTADYGGATGAVTVSLDTTAAQAVGGGRGTDRLYAIENLSGSGYSDRLTGNGLDNVIDGRGGNDTMTGLGGNDTYLVAQARDAVVEAAGGGRDTVIASVGYALGAGQEIEVLQLAPATGTAALNLTGNEFENALIGNGGANILDGKAGADTMTGLAGNDTYFVDHASDRVIEAKGGGTDLVYASVSYTLAAKQEIEALRLLASTGTAALNLTGNEFANALTGNGGANILDGKAGADTMTGLAGNDTYFVDHASDRVIEAKGGGTDLVYASVSYTLAAKQEIEALRLLASTGTAALNLTGNEFANALTGNGGANILDGKAGADTMTGLAGNDTYFVDHASDRVIEAKGGGTDLVYASTGYTLAANQEIEALRLLASTGTTALNLTGNEFANALTGNKGDNILDGKAGADTMTGLAGRDSFQFSTALSGGTVDTITDFSRVDDTIRLSAAVFTGLDAGALAAAAFKDLSTGAVDDSDRILYDRASGALFYDADGSGAGLAVRFATLANKAVINEADFLVY